jgi:hypothetical protein
MSNWRQIARRAAYWTIPLGILESWRAARRRRQRSALTARNDVQQNVDLRDKYRGERAFILACGPSITSQDLSVLRGEKCISVANFFVHPEFSRIRPLYHCIAPLHAPFTDEDGERWFRQMAPEMSKTTLLVSASDKKLIQSRKLLSGNDIRYLNFCANWNDGSNPDFDLARPLPAPQSVSIMALMSALYLGFHEIFLVGTDHTFFDPSDGRYDYQHFYVDPQANALGKEPPAEDLEIGFSCQAVLWQQYKTLRALARVRGVSIYNASAGGILDLFPRVRLEELKTTVRAGNWSGRPMAASGDFSRKICPFVALFLSNSVHHFSGLQMCT